MSHGFSAASLKSMEGIFDYHISELRKRIEEYAVSGEQFNLKELIAFYAYDIIGELAFSKKFGTLRSGNPIDLPPINDHVFLGCMYGMLPNLLPYSMRLTKYIPLPYVQKMLKSRLWLRNTTAECVGAEMTRSKDPQSDREKNLLTQLINAKDPDSGAGLTHSDVASEAFGFLVAGSHTTSGTLTLLFYHLLHSPKAASLLTKELDDQIELLDKDSNYNYQTLDSKLPYTRACIQENYRITPVFTMPLPRVVTGKYPISSRKCFSNQCLRI
jgi:cytochrome P450